MTSSDPIATNSRNLSIVTDEHLAVIYCNDELFSSLHATPPQIIDRHIFYLHRIIDIKECIKVTRGIIKHSLSNGVIRKGKLNKNRRIRDWEVSAVYGSGKKILGFWFTEIKREGKKKPELLTKLKKARDLKSEQKASVLGSDSIEDDLHLVKSEQQFRSLSENVPGAVYEFIYHRDGTSGFKYLSPNIVKLFGIPVGKFIGSLDHIVSEDKPKLLEAIKHSSETNEPFYFEGRLKAAEGRIRWHSASSSYSYSTENSSRVFTGIIQDITERKMIEEEKQKNEERFRLALTKIGDNFWEHHFLRNETFFSETIFDLIGYKSKDLQSNVKLWWSNIHLDDKWMVEETDLKYRTGKFDNHILEYRVFHANGTIKWIRDRGVVIEKTEEGMPVLIVGTHTDITKEKEFLEINIMEERKKKKEILHAMLHAQEKERELIAYELHDNINQVLSSCYVILDWMTVNETVDKSKLMEVKRNINLVIEELEGISYCLSTSTLQMIGLPQALLELVTKLSISSKLKIKLHKISGKVEDVTNSGINLAIYRIIQEQLVNITRNSRAKRANIMVGIDRNMIFAEITDDRKDIDQNSDLNGIGLINILNWVECLNGLIEFNNKPGNGFRLRIAIPIVAATYNSIK